MASARRADHRLSDKRLAPATDCTFARVPAAPRESSRGCLIEPLLVGEFQDIQVAPRPQAKDEKAESNAQKNVMRLRAIRQQEQYESDTDLQDRRPATDLAPPGILHHEALAQNFILQGLGEAIVFLFNFDHYLTHRHGRCGHRLNHALTAGCLHPRIHRRGRSFPSTGTRNRKGSVRLSGKGMIFL